MSLFAMGLNHDTQENFKPTDDIIVTPTDINAATGPSVVIGTNVSPDAADPAGVAALDNFEDYDIVIETGDELTKEQVRLEDIAQVVMANETISCTEVKAVLAMLPADQVDDEQKSKLKYGGGFLERFTQKLPLNTFTEAPSGVNVKETRSFVKKEMEVNYEKLAAVASEFVTEKSNDFLTRADRLINRIEQAVVAHAAWGDQCEALLKQANASNSYLAYWVQESTNNNGEVHRSNELIDVRHVPLGDYKFSQILEKALGVDASFFYAVSEYLRTEQGKSMITISTRGNQYDYTRNSTAFISLVEKFNLDPGTYPELSLSSYVEILSFFARREIVARLETLKTAVDEKVELLRQYALDEVENERDHNRLKSGSEVIKFLLDSIAGMREANTFIYNTDAFREVFKPVTVAMTEWLSK